MVALRRSIFCSTIFAEPPEGSVSDPGLLGSSFTGGWLITGGVPPLFPVGVVFFPPESAMGRIMQSAIIASRPPPEIHAMMGLAFI